MSIYSFRNVNVIYGGAPITGFFTGDDVIEVTKTQKLVSTIVGADGQGTYNVSSDLSGKLVMKILASSPANDIFAASYEAMATGGVVLPVPILISDTYGTTLVSGLFLVEDIPEGFVLGEKDAGRSWSFVTTQLILFPGKAGN